jgi:YD repeat-containing protein
MSPRHSRRPEPGQTVIDPRRQTTMAYDAAGRMTGLTDPNGNHTTCLRFGRSNDHHDRPARPLATYVYNNDDQLTDTTDRNSRRTPSRPAAGKRARPGFPAPAARPTCSPAHTTRQRADEHQGQLRDLTFTHDSGGNQLTAATSGGHRPAERHPDPATTSCTTARAGLTT